MENRRAVPYTRNLSREGQAWASLGSRNGCCIRRRLIRQSQPYLGCYAGRYKQCYMGSDT